MVDGVNSAEGFRKAEGEGVGSDLVNDFVGAKIFVGEFFGGAGGAEELSFNVGFLSYLEIGGRNAIPVGGFLVAELCIPNLIFKVFMQLTKIEGEFSGAV